MQKLKSNHPSEGKAINMNYKVKALFCVGKRRTFKNGEVVSGTEFDNPDNLVKLNFLSEAPKEDATKEPVREEAPGEPRVAETPQSQETLLPKSQPAQIVEAPSSIEPTIAPTKGKSRVQIDA